MYLLRSNSELIEHFSLIFATASKPKQNFKNNSGFKLIWVSWGLSDWDEKRRKMPFALLEWNAQRDLVICGWLNRTLANNIIKWMFRLKMCTSWKKCKNGINLECIWCKNFDDFNEVVTQHLKNSPTFTWLFKKFYTFIYLHSKVWFD